MVSRVLRQCSLCRGISEWIAELMVLARIRDSLGRRIGPRRRYTHWGPVFFPPTTSKSFKTCGREKGRLDWRNFAAYLTNLSVATLCETVRPKS